jgi:hypothetical protein
MFDLGYLANQVKEVLKWQEKKLLNKLKHVS